MNDLKKCFLIAPIGDQGSDTRNRSDLVMEIILRPAVEACGYQVERADELSRPGMITNQVIQRIVTDPLVIADLTESNPNVFYELAIRHALRKPLVHILRQGDKPPFDIAQTKVIFFDLSQANNIVAAKRGISQQIKAMEEDPRELETPISVALNLQVLQGSGRSEDRSLAELVERVAFLSANADAHSQEILNQLNDTKRSIKLFDDQISRSRERTSAFRMGLRMSPDQINQLLNSSDLYRGSMGILTIASLFRDSFPWVYEFGMEAYRKTLLNNVDSDKAGEHFYESIQDLAHGPLRELLRVPADMIASLEHLGALVKERTDGRDDAEAQDRKKPQYGR
jgi:hypothetical protein